MSKVTYYSVKRDQPKCQKETYTVSKETSKCQKRPTKCCSGQAPTQTHTLSLCLRLRERAISQSVNLFYGERYFFFCFHGHLTESAKYALCLFFLCNFFCLDGEREPSHKKDLNTHSVLLSASFCRSLLTFCRSLLAHVIPVEYRLLFLPLFLLCYALDSPVCALYHSRTDLYHSRTETQTETRV